MYIWNINSLVKDIKHRTLTEDEKVKYYIAYSILIMFAFGVGAILPYQTSNPKSHMLVIVANMAITVAGIIICNYKNKQIDGIDFIERSVLIGLPLLIRIAVFIFIFNIAFVYFSKNNYSFMVYIDNGIFEFFFSVLLVSLYFGLMYDAFNKLSQIKEPVGYFPKKDMDIEID